MFKKKEKTKSQQIKMAEKSEGKFKHIREGDRNNLARLLFELEDSGFQSELKGSAVYEPNYSDIDLNVWDADEKGPGWHFGKRAIDKFLNKLDAKEINYDNPIMATWCEGRWCFKFNQTNFDIIYTPRGPWYSGYALIVKTTIKDKK